MANIDTLLDGIANDTKASVDARLKSIDAIRALRDDKVKREDLSARHGEPTGSNTSRPS
jgi:hypothetical protein